MTDTARVCCTNGHVPPPERSDARFCTICGAPMVVTCPSGHLVEVAPLCSVCGVPLPPTGPPVTMTAGTVAIAGPDRDDRRTEPPTPGLVAGVAMAKSNETSHSPPPPPPGSTRAKRLPSRSRRTALGVLLILVIGAGAYFGVTSLNASHSGRTLVEQPPVLTSPLPANSAMPTPTVPQRPSAVPTTQPPTAAPASPASIDPQAVVQAYFDDINVGDYAGAWSLGGKNITPIVPYSTFVQGFANTASETDTIVSAVGDTVAVQVDATQTDGTHQYFAGTYTVRGGVIVAADVQLQ